MALVEEGKSRAEILHIAIEELIILIQVIDEISHKEHIIGFERREATTLLANRLCLLGSFCDASESRLGRLDAGAGWLLGDRGQMDDAVFSRGRFLATARQLLKVEVGLADYGIRAEAHLMGRMRTSAFHYQS